MKTTPKQINVGHRCPGCGSRYNEVDEYQFTHRELRGTGHRYHGWRNYSVEVVTDTCDYCAPESAENDAPIDQPVQFNSATQMQQLIQITTDAQGASVVSAQTYFEKVRQLAATGEQYPVNLDEVWPLVYAEKGKAVRALKKDFFEGEDFEVFAQNGKNPIGGRPEVEYRLTVSCMEYFIARKVRAVFEVYRQVFHRVADRIEQPTPAVSSATEHLLVQLLASQQDHIKQQTQLLTDYNQRITALEQMQQSGQRATANQPVTPQDWQPQDGYPQYGTTPGCRPQPGQFSELPQRGVEGMPVEVVSTILKWAFRHDRYLGYNDLRNKIVDTSRFVGSPLGKCKAEFLITRSVREGYIIPMRAYRDPANVYQINLASY